jgi:hypothetical protein
MYVFFTWKKKTLENVNNTRYSIDEVAEGFPIGTMAIFKLRPDTDVNNRKSTPIQSPDEKSHDDHTMDVRNISTVISLLRIHVDDGERFRELSSERSAND